MTETTNPFKQIATTNAQHALRLAWCVRASNGNVDALWGALRYENLDRGSSLGAYLDGCHFRAWELGHRTCADMLESAMGEAVLSDLRELAAEFLEEVGR